MNYSFSPSRLIFFSLVEYHQLDFVFLKRGARSIFTFHPTSLCSKLLFFLNFESKDFKLTMIECDIVKTHNLEDPGY